MDTPGTGLWQEIFRKYYKSILLITLLGVVFSYGMVKYVMTPEYQVSSTILYGPTKQTNISNINDLLQTTTTYNNLLDSQQVAKIVIDKYHLNMSVHSLTSEVTTTVNSQSLLSTIQVTNPSPDLAVSIANDYASTAVDYLPQVLPYDTIKVIDYANKSLVSKIRPQEKGYLALGLAIGFLVGVLLAFIRYQQFIRRKAKKRQPEYNPEVN